MVSQLASTASEEIIHSSKFFVAKEVRDSKQLFTDFTTIAC